MDIQLKELIDKIKSEGVKTAEDESGRIIHDAEKKAEEIRAHAHKKASRIIADAREEAARFEQSSHEAILQAARNLILSLKTQIMELFETVIKTGIEENLSDKVLQDAIVSLIKSWNEKNLSDVQVLISPADLKKVENKLRSSLAVEIKKGVELKPFEHINAGFRVSMKNGSSYYDFSDQGIAVILCEYLNPRLSEILSKAVSDTEKER